MKKRTAFTALFRIMGIIVLILGIRMIGEGIYNYIDEHHQADWISTTAYVIDISSEYSGTRGNRSVNYDITYQYEVNGEKYSYTLYNRSSPKGIGDTVKIKYDPNSPEKSTDILKPSVYNLAIFLIFGAIFTVIGFFLSGTWALIHKIRRRGEPEEEEYLPPEEYAEPEESNSKPQRPVIKIALRVVIIAVILCGIFLSVKLFPGIQPIGTDKFIEIAEKYGYSVSDSTANLSQDWKVGSMLKEACSFNDGNIRMDFAVMDTANSAAVLFNGMTLPVTDGNVKDSDGTVHEFYSVENETLYTAKIRIGDTVLYVSAKAECKQNAEELLKELGYWKE